MWLEGKHSQQLKWGFDRGWLLIGTIGNNKVHDLQDIKYNIVFTSLKLLFSFCWGLRKNYSEYLFKITIPSSFLYRYNNKFYVKFHYILKVISHMCMYVLVAQLCPTICDPMDCSPPGSSVHGIVQAWILDWVAISFARGSSWPRDWTEVSCIAGRFFTAGLPGKQPSLL